MKGFQDRVAVVTGAASGIGRAMAETFVDAGMKVVLADVDQGQLENTVQALQTTGAEVIGVPTDVSKADQVEALAEKTEKTFGGAHILCNNAGVGYSRINSWETPPEAWQWVIGVNLMGVLHGIHYFMPMMIRQDTEAHIVNTASIAGLTSDFTNMPYGVTKHGVVALSEDLHLELLFKGYNNIKVSVLCPGPVNTDIMNSIERNRPKDLPPQPDLPPELAVYRKAYEIWLQRGMAPKEVSRQVFEAIREERLYIIPTPDFDDKIEERMRNILERKNPAISQPPQDLLNIFMEVSGGKA